MSHSGQNKNYDYIDHANSSKYGNSFKVGIGSDTDMRIRKFHIITCLFFKSLTQVWLNPITLQLTAC